MKISANAGREILSRAGHDVATVASQSLEKAGDAKLIECCRREARRPGFTGLDFANPLHFKPSQYSGIAVLRLPRKPSHADLLKAVHTLAAGLEREKLDGQLWVVESGRIRVFQEKQTD